MLNDEDQKILDKFIEIDDQGFARRYLENELWGLPDRVERAVKIWAIYKAKQDRRDDVLLRDRMLSANDHDIAMKLLLAERRTDPQRRERIWSLYIQTLEKHGTLNNPERLRAQANFNAMLSSLEGVLPNMLSGY